MEVLKSRLDVNEDDLPFEEEVLRNKYSVKSWLLYADHKKKSNSFSIADLYMIYERALKELPGSYKIWHRYLKERMLQVKDKCPTSPAYQIVNTVFERALVTMHKMPRIWITYLSFLLQQRRITTMRQACDRALRALPVTQHERVWDVYIQFARSDFLPIETSVRIFKRYLMLEPNHIEEYIQFLQEHNRLNDAAEKLAEVVNKEKFTSVHGKSNHELWVELCNLCAHNPYDVTSIKVVPIIKSGLAKFKDEVGRLWTLLADYYIRLAHFEKARDVYEEGLKTVMTVRDFSQIFDAYTQFEESMLSAFMEQHEEDAAEESAAAKQLKVADEAEEMELDLRMIRLEDLLDRRPLLLNSVMLRQNPHNVYEWLKRVRLMGDNMGRVVETFTEACRTVDPLHPQLTGKASMLWINFAKFYEKHEDLSSARQVMKAAINAKNSCKTVDEMANLACEWAEMELRNKAFDEALGVMRYCTLQPKAALPKSYKDSSVPIRDRLFLSTRLWAFYVDLEESLGTFETTKAVYDRMMDLKVCTVQIILNYARFLEEKHYFEDAFTVYERGTAMFKYPMVAPLWDTYLSRFIARHKGRKLERTRDLFEQAIASAPAKESKPLYLKYATLEEEHGTLRHAIKIYDRAAAAVEDEDKEELFNVYIARVAKYFGVTHTRQVYEKAIELLPPNTARKFCVRYAGLEAKLGEIDRARGVYVHGSQFADPRTAGDYWAKWQEFEVQHGNEETFREMLRVRRSVQAQFNMQATFSAQAMLEKAEALEKSGDTMKALESAMQDSKTAAEIALQAGAGQGQGAGRVQFVSSKASEKLMESRAGENSNPEEINLDSDDEEETVEAPVVKTADGQTVEEQSVPNAVFGGLKREREESSAAGSAEAQAQAQVPTGAKERFAAKKKKLN
eukprot:GCRY01000836.1.p1 GENE.GCRY01000836.1~~GCRY01000836.1.p1  ORF type:complete len:905 (-),score=281.88 GCRY01000836.1:88-2802(-)